MSRWYIMGWHIGHSSKAKATKQNKAHTQNQQQQKYKTNNNRTTTSKCSQRPEGLRPIRY